MVVTVDDGGREDEGEDDGGGEEDGVERERENK